MVSFSSSSILTSIGRVVVRLFGESRAGERAFGERRVGERGVGVGVFADSTTCELNFF